MNKEITRLIMISTFAIFVLLFAPKDFHAATITYLDELEPSQTTGDAMKNKWDYNTAFEDINGNLIDRGVGLFFGNGTSTAVYHIEKMGYTNLEAELTLDKRWTFGDYGQSAVAVYADDHQLYEKQISKADGIVPIHINLPSDTKNLKIIVKQIEGAQGEQRVIFARARLSTDGTPINVAEETSLNTIGATQLSGFISEEYWYRTPFQDVKGNIITDGVGLHCASCTAVARYTIDPLNDNIFETKVSLDSKWIAGDYGTSAVGIYADDYKLYEKQLTPQTPVQTVTVKIPKGTKYLYLITKQLKGAKGDQQVNFSHPVLKKTDDSPLIVPRNANVQTVGAIAYSGYKTGLWYEIPFQYVNGDLPTSGVSFYSDGSYATYDITGMDFNTFTANLSLDANSVIGNWGKSAIFFYANDKLIDSENVTKATGINPISLHLPSNTTTFKIMIKQTKGALGWQNIVLGDAQFRNYSYTPSVAANHIKVVNNTGKSDTVSISNLVSGDIIKVYNSAGKVLYTSPKASGSTVSMSIPQIGPKQGTLYVTAKRGSMLESSKTAVTYTGEKTSSTKIKKVNIKNNRGKYDTITVSSLQKNDYVQVYSAKGVKIASGKAVSSAVTIYVKQLGASSKYVYLTLKSDGMTESSKVKVMFKGE